MLCLHRGRVHGQAVHLVSFFQKESALFHAASVIKSHHSGLILIAGQKIFQIETEKVGPRQRFHIHGRLNVSRGEPVSAAYPVCCHKGISYGIMQNRKVIQQHRLPVFHGIDHHHGSGTKYAYPFHISSQLVGNTSADLAVKTGDLSGKAAAVFILLSLFQAEIIRRKCRYVPDRHPGGIFIIRNGNIRPLLSEIASQLRPVIRCDSGNWPDIIGGIDGSRIRPVVRSPYIQIGGLHHRSSGIIPNGCIIKKSIVKPGLASHKIYKHPAADRQNNHRSSVKPPGLPVL